MASLINPFEAIDMVYADFDYPEEVESLVSYMPSTDGYNPLAHTEEENKNNLHAKLVKFLKDNDCHMNF